MLRWARQNRRLSFVLAMTGESLPPPVITKLAGLSKLGSIGLCHEVLERCDDAQKRRFSQAPFVRAECPTYGLRELPRLIGGGQIVPIVASLVAGQIHGSPLCLIGDQALAAAEPLIIHRAALRLGKTESAQKKSFQEAVRSGAWGAIDSLKLADKAILPLIDYAGSRAREKTLRGQLMRQCDRRLHWVNKACEQSFKRVEPLEEGQAPALVFLDLLPLIIKKLDDDRARRLGAILATPLGAQIFGVSPALVL